MSYVTYTALRNLSASNGHVANTQYTLYFNAVKSRTPTRKATEHVADDGTTYTVTDRIDTTWNIVTRPVKAVEAEIFREFLFSVYDGSTFVLDPYGSEFAVDNQLDCILQGDWAETPINFGRFYRYSFSARVLP